MQNGTHDRTCHLCEAMCGVAVEMKGGQIASIRGDDKNPLSHGHICPKAVALQDLHEDPERLRKPVRKTPTGWQEIEWDEAFRTVAEKLHNTRSTHGRNSIGVYLGNPNVHNHGSLIATMPFLRAVGSQNRFSATSNDQLPHMLASLEMFGHQVLFPIPDIDNTDLFICIGGNPMASNGSLMTVPDFRGRLKALKQRGGKMIVVDPRRTETARLAEEFHFIRPGTDAFLLMAMVNTLFADELIHPGPAEHLIKDLDLLRLASLPFKPDAVAERTGVAAATIRDLAHQLANTSKAALYTRMGTSTQTFGSITTWLAYCLNILTGKLDTVGGVMFTQPAIDLIAIGAMSGQRGHFGKRHSRVKGLPEFAGEYPASTMADEMLTPGEGQIRAFVTVAGNPVLSSPNGRRLDEALSGLDFMVSVDYYINETTRHADIILPPTAALERSHYDIVFNMLAVRNVSTGPYGTGAGRASGILEPATSLILDLLPKHHPLRSLAKLSSLNPQWQTLPKGLSLKRLKEKPSGIDLGALRPALPDRLFTRDGKINLAPRRYLEDVERLHQKLSTPEAPGELLLIGRRHMRSNNSWMHNSHRLVKGKARCTLLVHPNDASRLGLKEGCNAEIRANNREIVMPVEITEDMMPGVVSIPHGWGHNRDGTRQSTASAHAGASINDVLSDQHIDPVAGTSVLNGQSVTVKVWQPKQQPIPA